MARQPQPVHPIQALREHITALEATITLSLADPQPKPVHRLRTTTRRVEATLALVAMLPDLPDHARPARKCLRLLKKLRRAAGSVRDLDVHQDLLEGISDKNPALLSVPPKAGVPASRARQKMQQDAVSLRKLLKHQRDGEAKALLKKLQKLQLNLAPALEQLLNTLASAESLTLTPGQLAEITGDWYRHHTPSLQEAISADDPDLLHTLRKSAKLARYIAELAVAQSQGTARPRKLPQKAASGPREFAAPFESIQRSGGTWHDLLTLAEIARHHLGKHSVLTRHFQQSRDQALHHYQEHIKISPA